MVADLRKVTDDLRRVEAEINVIAAEHVRTRA